MMLLTLIIYWHFLKAILLADYLLSLFLTYPYPQLALKSVSRSGLLLQFLSVLSDKFVLVLKKPYMRSEPQISKSIITTCS